MLVRYADDLVALCHTREQAEQVKARLAEWLAPRGLAFNEDKTRIVPLDEGFDFLGFTVRRYRGKLLIKPSKAAIRRIRERLARRDARPARRQRARRSSPRLNPIIRGWAAYYRTVVSSEVVHVAGQLPVEAHLQVGQAQPPEQAETLDHPPLLRQVQQVQERPVGVRRPRQRRLPAPSSPGRRSSDTRWSKGRRPPTTPTLADYWADTAPQRQPPPMDPTNLRLLQAQHGRCPLCRGLLLHADRQPQTPPEWEQWLTVTRKAMTRNSIIVRADGEPDGMTNIRLLHTSCHRRTTGTDRKPAILHAARPRGLLEPDAGKRARPVLRGPGRSNALGLPGRSDRVWPDTGPTRSL